ncbi:CoxG family protein [Sandarakinorhabdus sp. DWP1-3-1]|uniref:CoxG family protein n=1 Tax=Sandarakinorhabdus sp. DWP1-3-1 TaxID=2804627 RepID=UPI003CF5D427
MELSGNVTINAARDRVWAALNDPDVLARCIEGVETLTRVTGDAGERFEGKMNAKVGPVRATFTGQVTLTEVNAPESYVLVGEGKGGVAGFAKGEAAVQLAAPGPDTTDLSYQVKSSVGGKLAQLGARLIEGTAKGYAESFFARLKAELETPVTATPEPVITDAPITPVAAPQSTLPELPTGVSPLVWGGGLVVAVLIFLVWQWG